MMAITIPILLMIREPSKKPTKKLPLSQENIDYFSRVSVNNNNGENNNNDDIDNFHGSTSAEVVSTTNAVGTGEP